MICIRENCFNDVIGNPRKIYCSVRCSRLAEKKRYRKKHHEQILAYNRQRKRKGIRGSPSTNNIIAGHLSRNPKCAKCETREDLHVCHIKPRVFGGRNIDNLITLCRRHHHQFDESLRQFWSQSTETMLH